MSARSYTRIALAITLALILAACGAPTESAAPSPTAPPAPTAAEAQPTPARPTAPPSPTAAPAPTDPPAPTQASAPTAAPDATASEPEETVRAFLTRFANQGDPAIDPAAYLSSSLRAQIRPDYPLNLIVGVQNMYSGFQILGSEGAAGTVRVRAELSYTDAPVWTFALIQENGQWRIDQIVRPSIPSIPAPTAQPAPQPAGGAIFYLDPDGSSINRINPDGSGQQLVWGEVDRSLGGPISYIGPVPGSSFAMVMIGAGTHYATASGGVSVDLGNFAATPRWSPDGWRVAGPEVTDSGRPGAIAIFDMRARQRTTLPVSGTPDWYPDGQRLVYAACGEQDDLGCNVYSYDLASGASARLSELVSSESDRWHVQEAHVLPGGDAIVFYGNHTSEVGASGNGQQWWWMPIGGGEAQLFSESYGNGVSAYQADPRGGLIAYATRAHVSACASTGTLVVRDTAVTGDSARGDRPALPGSDEANRAYALVHGLSWDPAGSGGLVFGSQAYTCGPQDRQMQTPGIYMWQPGDAPHKLADGSFPVWVPSAGDGS